MSIKIELVYALPEKQYIKKLIIPKNTTVKKAIEKSNILNIYKKINLEENKVGIFNTIVNLDTILKNGDRLEIYRKLICDPKTLRKKRIKKAFF